MKIHYKAKIVDNLFKLKLLKTKIYGKKYIFANTKLEEFEHEIRKSFEIIQKFDSWGKRILFILPTLELETKIKIKKYLKKSSHSFISETSSELISLFKDNSKIKLFKKYDLIIILTKKKHISIIWSVYDKPMICNIKEKFYETSDYVIMQNSVRGYKKVQIGLFLKILKDLARRRKRIKMYKMLQNRKGRKIYKRSWKKR